MVSYNTQFVLQSHLLRTSYMKFRLQCSGTTHSKNVMILFQPSLDFEIESIFADNGRYFLLKANVLESSFLFSNIYAPNDSTAQIAFLHNLDNILLPFADAQIILEGDMNCPLTPTDKIGGAPVQKKKVIDEIEGLIWRFKLHDIWRNQHTNKTQFTWRDNSLKVQCRIPHLNYRPTYSVLLLI